MDLLISLATTVDRLDPAIGALLGHFRDERMPIELSVMIFAAAAALLAALIVCAGTTMARIRKLRGLVRSCGTAAAFAERFAQIDERFSASIFRDSWGEYRQFLRHTSGAILYFRRPDEALDLHAIDGKAFPARFFAAAHGYFIGLGLMLTFVGLIAALKFAATGVASPDLAVAKSALDALLAAAAFKFMTSIAGLGSALILSIATRSATYAVESAASRLAREIERVMEPILSESVAYDHLAATRAQLGRLERIEAGLSAVAAHQTARLPSDPYAVTPNTEAQSHEALQKILTAFLAELRGAAGGEIKQLAGKLTEVGSAIAAMQGHVGRSGQRFADQIDLASTRLLAAATKLQESVGVRAEQAGMRLDAQIGSMATAFSRGEALLSGAAAQAASALAAHGGELNANLRAQTETMRDIVALLDRTRAALNESASTWTQCTAPVVASVNASRQITSELGQIAGRVGAAQRDMAEMAKAVTQLSERIGIVWDNYRSRFEKVDDDLQTTFERLQGGTRAFGEEVMDFVGKLDASLANGMQAFSLGTEELREVAQMFVTNGTAKAA